jgi:dephospho-CoA kinase
MDATTAAARVDAQTPQAEKVARANVVIDTDGAMDETRAQFEAAWAELTIDH